MKLNRTYLFIVVSSIAMVAILVIQVNWILQTAQIKETLFNEKANMVLSKTADAISADKEACQNLESGASKNEINKIDSLFRHFMRFYNIRIDYTFVVVKPAAFNVEYGSGFGNNVYQKRIDEVFSEKGLELKLIFPDKKQFILAEMGTLFITSVVLILVVLILFWRTIRSLKREKQLSEHTTEFLNNMTHEFKTPLTNIALAGKMLLKDPNIRQENKVRHYSGIILEENEKLSLQVEQVLNMTAFERGEIPLRKTTLNFHELIHDSLKYISIQVENKKGHIHLDLRAEQFMIVGDKTHLTNALCNLVDNAIKYSTEPPEITIQTSNKGSSLIINVVDKGIGIEKEFHDKVFEKFFRVPTGNVHDVKGFGIGLSYLKKIVELHVGTVKLQSEPGKGTAFTITLPYA